jgi:YbgC/YbaW family acyl-CoA thioester hydrolase
MPVPAPFVVEEYVRWSDVDYAGIIFYGSYIRFFEIAETELFRAAGLAYGDVFDRFGIFLPRKTMQSEFFRPARLDDHLRVAAYIARVGKTSMTINFDVTWGDAATIGAAASQVLVCVDRTSLVPRPLPPELLRALAPYTLPADAARAALHVAVP